MSEWSSDLLSSDLDRNAQVLQVEKAAVWMHLSQVDEHVPRFAPQSLQEFRKRVVEVLQGASAQQDVLAVCMLHRVDEGELALGIVALRPAPACRHHGRQVVDGPGQVRRVVDVLAESVVAHADVTPEVEHAALSVRNQVPEPEAQPKRKPT